MSVDLQAKGKFDLQSTVLQWASQQKRTRLLVQETQVQFWGRKVHWNRKWQPAPVFLPVKAHGQRSLAGYSSWSCRESDTTEHTPTHTHTHTHTHSKTTRHLTFYRNQMVDVLTGIILMWLELGFVKYRLIFSKYLRLTQIKINFVSYIFIQS